MAIRNLVVSRHGGSIVVHGTVLENDNALVEQLVDMGGMHKLNFCVNRCEDAYVYWDRRDVGPRDFSNGKGKSIRFEGVLFHPERLRAVNAFVAAVLAGPAPPPVRAPAPAPGPGTSKSHAARGGQPRADESDEDLVVSLDEMFKSAVSSSSTSNSGDVDSESDFVVDDDDSSAVRESVSNDSSDGYYIPPEESWAKPKKATPEQIKKAAGICRKRKSHFVDSSDEESDLPAPTPAPRYDIEGEIRARVAAAAIVLKRELLVEIAKNRMKNVPWAVEQKQRMWEKKQRKEADEKAEEDAAAQQARELCRATRKAAKRQKKKGGKKQ